MKTKNKKKNGRIAELLALAFMLPSAALAQASGSHGGGEDGVFKNIRNETSTWLQKNAEIKGLDRKLELNSMNGWELLAKYQQAVSDVGEKLVFNHDKIVFGDNVRICKNENKTITCNIDEWNSSHGDTRFMIVFHEYLGVAGIETNVEVDYSKYPISSKLLRFVKTKESFELGMEEVQSHAITCSLTTNNQNNVPVYKLFLQLSSDRKEIHFRSIFYRYPLFGKTKIKEKDGTYTVSSTHPGHGDNTTEIFAVKSPNGDITLDLTIDPASPTDLRKGAGYFNTHPNDKKVHENQGAYNFDDCREDDNSSIFDNLGSITIY